MGCAMLKYSPEQGISPLIEPFFELFGGLLFLTGCIAGSIGACFGATSTRR